jgi:peptidoglycan/LPS O-acetylase OafA/YrhL
MPMMTVSEFATPSVGDSTRTSNLISSSRHYAALDGLRGVAILSVMLYHFTGGYKGANPALRLWSAIADAGWMGVDLFFVLSGFLITGILYDTTQDEHKVKNFYARRALRIFPLFYAVLFALMLLTPVLHFHWRAEHLFYFFYLSNVAVLFAPNFQPPSQWINLGHLWSLAVEEQFYMLWPFIIWRVRQRTTLLWAILSVLIAGPLLRALLLAEGMNSIAMSRLLFTRADSLLFGGGVALLVRGPLANRIPAQRILIIAASLLALLLLLAHGPEATSPWICTIGYTAIAACSASLIYLAQQGSNWASNLFGRPLLQFFGRYSYGLYIFHGLYFVYLRHLATTLGYKVRSGVLAQLLIFAFGFLLSIALALLSYHFFEAPLLKLKRRFT